MLQKNSIYNAKVTSVDGFLCDHYDPVNKTANLSLVIYNGTNISAAAVAYLNVAMPFSRPLPAAIDFQK